MYSRFSSARSSSSTEAALPLTDGAGRTCDSSIEEVLWNGSSLAGTAGAAVLEAYRCNPDHGNEGCRPDHVNVGADMCPRSISCATVLWWPNGWKWALPLTGTGMVSEQQ